MEDYKIAEKLDVLSARSKHELDCNKKQYRNLFISLYSGHMGRGETLSILNERTFRVVFRCSSILLLGNSFAPESEKGKRGRRYIELSYHKRTSALCRKRTFVDTDLLWGTYVTFTDKRLFIYFDNVAYNTT